jgi:GTP-binding protein Era
MTGNDELDSIFSDDWPDDHHSGYAAVVGRPNVGKSTLINKLLGEKIAIVTQKPQTTRKVQLGIYTEERGQIIFVDTPGLHAPHHRLGEYMVEVAEQAIRDCDVILWVLDGSQPPTEDDRRLADRLKSIKRRRSLVVLALNKADLIQDEPARPDHLDLIQHDKAILISALNGDRVPELITYLLEALPIGPRYFPADQITETNHRFLAAEVIREKIILRTEKEVPYSVGVEITEYKERSEDLIYINATVYVERDSQKGIIVGKGGEMIKGIGSDARTELEQILGVRVFLDLHVKVLKDWRNDVGLMHRMGYRIYRDDNR